MSNEDQPTVEQSLHSIALSMININKELRETRKIQQETLRNTKQNMRQTRRMGVIPAKKGPFDWLLGLLGLTKGGVFVVGTNRPI